jgi:hypothetical protein
MIPRKLLTLIFALGFIALLSGCSNNETSPSAGDGDISDDFGGFKPTDEEPAFGDEVIAAEMTADDDFNDPMQSSFDIESAFENDLADIYALRIVWGQLRYDPEVTEPTDWSGTLTVSRGVEILRKVIKFEPSQDWIVLRDDPAVIEWVSQTTVHHDGIYVNIVVPPPDETDDTEPVTVTFDTEPFSITFDVAELPALDTIYYLEDDSNAVAFHAFKVERIGCPKGFLAGQWGKDEEGNGIFFGKWLSQWDELMGHLNGTWGDGEFFGKYIDEHGRFEGLIKGRYHSGNSLSPMHRRAGWFRGYYYDGDGNILGVLKGHYREVPRNSTMGFFQGRWRHYCNQIAPVDDGFEN